MAASPAIDLGESLEALFKRARIADKFYRKCEGKLEDLGVGDAGDLLTVVAVKGIASLGLHELQAEKLRRTLLGRRGWEDAAAVAASFGGLSLDDTPAGVAAGDQAAGGAASAPALDGMAVDGGYASADEDAGPAAGWPAAASGSKMEPGCSRSGAGTSAAAEGSEGAVAGSEGCNGARTPEAESGAREARAAVVAGGVGPAVSVDTSESAPPAEEGKGSCLCPLPVPGCTRVPSTPGHEPTPQSPDVAAGVGVWTHSSFARSQEHAVGTATDEEVEEEAAGAVSGAARGAEPDGPPTARQSRPSHYSVAQWAAIQAAEKAAWDAARCPRFRAALDAMPEQGPGCCDGGPELWAGATTLQDTEGWKELVKAGKILLFDEDRAVVMRYAPGGGRGRGRGGGSRSARWRGKRRGGRRGGWDDGDGLFGEHYGARGFDCPPDRAHLHEDDGAF